MKYIILLQFFCFQIYSLIAKQQEQIYIDSVRIVSYMWKFEESIGHSGKISSKEKIVKSFLKYSQSNNQFQVVTTDDKYLKAIVGTMMSNKTAAKLKKYKGGRFFPYIVLVVFNKNHTKDTLVFGDLNTMIIKNKVYEMDLLFLSLIASYLDVSHRKLIIEEILFRLRKEESTDDE